MSKPKSSVPATTKALQAWQSELRRLEKRLGEWASALAEREEILEQQETAFANAVEEADTETVQLYADLDRLSQDADTLVDGEYGEECDCDDDDAEAGCDCPKCEKARASAAKSQPVPVPGDEVKWLESLWKLADKRKKK